MKNKVISLFLAVVMIVPVFSPVFAVSYNDYITRLDAIKSEIMTMKGEYEDVITTYSDVIDSLSSENKQNALNFANGLMSDGIKEKLQKVKNELSVSTVPGADIVLNKINEIEDRSKELYNENIDIVEDIQNGYQELTVNEVKDIIGKVVEITDALSCDVETETTYIELVNIINEAHAIGNEINDKLNDLLDESIDYTSEIVTIDMLKELFNDIKNKDREAMVETLKNSIKGTTNEANIKAILDEIKSKITKLKNKLLEANDLDEKALIHFDDAKKQTISGKVKDIENDYISFTKSMIDIYAKDYIHELAKVTYDVEVDEMIEYTNDVIDVYVQYEDSINSILNNPQGKIKNYNFPADIKEAIQKAGILVAIGFADISEFNGDYFYNKFKTDLKNIADYISDEMLDYIDHVDVVLQKEITDEINNNTSSVAQTNIKAINVKRFATVEKIKALRTRVENEILNKSSNFDDAKLAIKKVAPFVYKMYYSNMLDAIEKVMGLENEKTNKKYEFNIARGYILTDSFMSKDIMDSSIGIPNEYNSIIKYTDLKDSKVKTGSVLDISFTEEVFGNYTFAVLGDVYADGKINSQDYMAIKNQIMEKKILGSINKIAADTYRDNKIDSRDYMKIKNYIMKDIKIGL